MIDGSNKIGSLSRMLELVRLSGAKRSERATLQGEKAPPRNSAPAVPRDMEVLKARLRRQVEGVDLEDDASVADGRRAILREILVWEFGEAIRNHSEFTTMIETIEKAMTANAGAQEKFAVVLADIKKAE